MKKLVISTLAALAVATSASAAYISASVGYLVDAEEAVFAVRGGIPFKVTESEKLGSLEHNAELEVGYLEQSETFSTGWASASLKFETIPVYVNYRASLRKGRWEPYAGAGLGFARVKGKASVSGFGSISDTDTAFAFQAFVGIQDNLSDHSALRFGARYVWRDGVDFTSGGTTLARDSSSDDVVLEAGYSFRF